jgi:hypothetical protein
MEVKMHIMVFLVMAWSGLVGGTCLSVLKKHTASNFR